METILGLLKVRLVKGSNLAIRDRTSSDPYVVVKLGNQTVKTRVIKGDLNPVWDEELTLSIPNPTPPLKLTVKTRVIKGDLNPVWDEELTLSIPNPTPPLKLQVFDKDKLSKDDKMGDAVIDLQPLVMAVSMRNALPLTLTSKSETELHRLVASKGNCLVKDSCIRHVDGKTVQEICLRLQNVECGELELQLKWVDLPRE